MNQSVGHGMTRFHMGFCEWPRQVFSVGEDTAGGPDMV